MRESGRYCVDSGAGAGAKMRTWLPEADDGKGARHTSSSDSKPTLRARSALRAERGESMVSTVDCADSRGGSRADRMASSSLLAHISFPSYRLRA